MNQLPYFLAAWLFFVGLYGMVTTRNFLHLVMCLGVLQASTYVLLLEVGYRIAQQPDHPTWKPDAVWRPRPSP